MTNVFICDAIRTPFGRYGGVLSSVRTDDLAALPLTALVERNPSVDWSALDDVVYGCANQAGEDNRNIARMALLLAGLPKEIPGATINRLCGSSLDAVGIAARAIKAGETELMIAGGAESMTRAPFVMGEAEAAFSRSADVFDTTIGWRFINPAMKAKYGVDSMPETAEIVAEEFQASRGEDQDAFALRSQQRWTRANAAGFFRTELIPVLIRKRRAIRRRLQRTTAAAAGHNPGRARETPTDRGPDGYGYCRKRVRSERRFVRTVARVRSGRKEPWPHASRAGSGNGFCGRSAPNYPGFAPAPAVRKVLRLAGLELAQIDVIELNEAFAAQAIAVTRDLLGLADDAADVNPNGGAISIGHPLGASGARLATTATYQLQATKGRYAICTMCIGVGQGIATILERC